MSIERVNYPVILDISKPSTRWNNWKRVLRFFMLNKTFSRVEFRRLVRNDTTTTRMLRTAEYYGLVKRRKDTKHPIKFDVIVPNKMLEWFLERGILKKLQLDEHDKIEVGKDGI